MVSIFKYFYIRNLLTPFKYGVAYQIPWEIVFKTLAMDMVDILFLAMTFPTFFFDSISC